MSSLPNQQTMDRHLQVAEFPPPQTIGNINDFSNEILSKILSYISVNEQLCRASLVCLRWYQLIKSDCLDLEQSLIITDRDSSSRIASSLTSEELTFFDVRFGDHCGDQANVKLVIIPSFSM